MSSGVFIRRENMSDKAEVVLDIKNLDISFHSATDTVHAIRGVDLKLRRGETIALVVLMIACNLVADGLREAVEI